MAEPTTPGEARRQGMNRSRWIAAGVAVGAAALLTGVIAGANGADDNGTSQQQISATDLDGVQQAPRYDDGGRYDDEYESDDDYGSARPFEPQQQSPSFNPPSGSSTQQSPSFGPQTRSGGS